MYKKIFLLFFVSFLLSCSQENKFSLNDNIDDFNEIIEAVIKEDSLKVFKNSNENYAVIEYLEKTEITNPKTQNRDSLVLITPPNSIVIGDLFHIWQVNIKGFDKKDSLYLLSQNSNPDSLRIADRLLSKIKHLTHQQINNEWEKGNYVKSFAFKIPFISKDKSKAYLESSYRCGGLCRQGQGYFLEKKNGQWKIVKKWGTWIS